MTIPPLPPERFLHKKSLGQNFLTSDVVPRWMCDAAALTPTDTVIEVGPGTGALTAEILRRGATVHAIETDSRAVAILQDRFATAIASGQLTLHTADIRTFAVATIIPAPYHYKVVANIPYYLSGYLLRLFLELETPPQTLVFLMQREVVERITRDPKSSLLSLSVAVYGHPTYVKTVSKGHFQPMPKVDSAILAVRHISHTDIPTLADREHFFMLLKCGLGQRRKQLAHLLKQLYPPDTVYAALAALGLTPTIRGEDLSLATWLALHRYLAPLSTTNTHPTAST